MRARIRENALYLVFNIVEYLGRHWRVLNGGLTVMALIIAGARSAALLPLTREPHDCPIVRSSVFGSMKRRRLGSGRYRLADDRGR